MINTDMPCYILPDVEVSDLDLEPFIARIEVIC